MKVILETRRLILREMGMQDLEFISSMLMSAKVMRYWPRPHTREESAEWITKQMGRYHKGGYGYWLAVDRLLGVPIGQAGLLKTPIQGADEPALGYIIHNAHWRRGYATEAAAACIGYAFDALDRPHAVALVRPENRPSIGVAEKLGMQAGPKIMYAGLEHIVYSLSRPNGGAEGARG